MNLNEAIDKFLDNLKELDRSPATITAYSKDLEQLFEVIGNKDLEDVETENINEFVESLSEKGFTNKTISRKLNSTKSLFKFLKEEKGLIDRDPSAPVPHPDIKTKLPRVLSETEYNAVREVARPNTRLYALIETMLQTGVRIGEVSRLQLEDLQLESNPAQMIIKEHASSPMRLVEVNPKMVEIFEFYVPRRNEPEGDEGYVFNTKNGGNMIIRNIRSAVNRIFEKAGIDDATVNDLRNTFIVYQLEEGVSLAKVAQQVGHKRYSSTEKYIPLLERDNLGNGERIVAL
jgi:site-specific recombinase XerD